ncbi:unnamed protein product [Boreogadus saida]
MRVGREGGGGSESINTSAGKAKAIEPDLSPCPHLEEKTRETLKSTDRALNLGRIGIPEGNDPGNREDYRTTTLLLLLVVVVVVVAVVAAVVEAVVVAVVVEAVVVGGAGPWTRYPVQGPLSPLAAEPPQSWITALEKPLIALSSRARAKFSLD